MEVTYETTLKFEHSEHMAMSKDFELPSKILLSTLRQGK